MLQEGSGTPEWTRTTDLLLRRQTLYPTELRAHTGRNFTLIVPHPAIARPGRGRAHARATWLPGPSGIFPISGLLTLAAGL